MRWLLLPKTQPLKTENKNLLYCYTKQAKMRYKNLQSSLEENVYELKCDSAKGIDYINETRMLKQARE